MKMNSIYFSKIRYQLVLYIWSLGFRYYNLEFPKIRCWRIYGFMQNEPNFQGSRQTLTLVIAETYNERPLVNQTITNPIEPNTNPIGKPPKINPNSCHNRKLQRKTSFAPKNNEPNRTQSQPITNPNEPNFDPCLTMSICLTNTCSPRNLCFYEHCRNNCKPRERKRYAN